MKKEQTNKEDILLKHMIWIKLDKNEDYAKKSDFEALKLEVNRISELLAKNQQVGGSKDEQ